MAKEDKSTSGAFFNANIHKKNAVPAEDDVVETTTFAAGADEPITAEAVEPEVSKPVAAPQPTKKLHPFEGAPVLHENYIKAANKFIAAVQTHFQYLRRSVIKKQDAAAFEAMVRGISVADLQALIANGANPTTIGGFTLRLTRSEVVAWNNFLKHQEKYLLVVSQNRQEAADLKSSEFNEIVSRVRSTFDTPVAAESNTEKITKAQETAVNLRTDRTEKAQYSWGKELAVLLIRKAAILGVIGLLTGGLSLYSVALSFIAGPIIGAIARSITEKMGVQSKLLGFAGTVVLSAIMSIVLGVEVSSLMHTYAGETDAALQSGWSQLGNWIHGVKDHAEAGISQAVSAITPDSSAPVPAHPVPGAEAVVAPVDTVDNVLDVNSFFEKMFPNMPYIHPNADIAQQIYERGGIFNIGDNAFQIVETPNGGFEQHLLHHGADKTAPTWIPGGHDGGFWIPGTESSAAAAPSAPEVIPPPPDVGPADPSAVGPLHEVPRAEVVVPQDGPGIQHPGAEAVAAVPSTGVPEFDLLGNPTVEDLMREYSPQNMLESGMSPEKVEMWGKLHDLLIANRDALNIGDQPPAVRLGDFFGNSSPLS